MADEVAQFARWLDQQLKDLQEMGGPGDDAQTNALIAAEVVKEVSDRARKIGAGDLAVHRLVGHEGQAYYPVHEAKTVIGKMRAWCRDQQDDPDLLTVEQAAHCMNVDDRTVYALCENKVLKHHRIGNGRGTIRIRRVDLDRYLQRNKVEVRASDVEVDYLSG